MVLPGMCGVDEVEWGISLLYLPGVRGGSVAAGDACSPAVLEKENTGEEQVEASGIHESFGAEVIGF